MISTTPKNLTGITKRTEERLLRCSGSVVDKEKATPCHQNSETPKVVPFLSARDPTQGPAHARQVLYTELIPQLLYFF